MSNLALIQPQRQDFTTCQVTDWLDGLPLIATAGPGGVVASGANAGKGALAMAAVDAGADPSGAQLVTVDGISGGLTTFTVTDLDGAVTGRGVVGLPAYAGGVAFTLSQVVGQSALVVGDTFAMSTLPVPVDLTGLTFALDSRIAAPSATFAIQAFSAPPDGSAATIAVDAAGGGIALRVPQAAMARCPASPTPYPYVLYAADPATGQRVIAFFGSITHLAVLRPQD